MEWTVDRLDFTQDRGRFTVTVALAADAAAAAGLSTSGEFMEPVRSAIREHIDGSEATARFVRVARQKGAAEHRQELLSAKLEELRAKRRVAELEAKAGLAARLLRIDGEIASATAALDQVLAELNVLRPLADIAGAEQSEELAAICPRLVREMTAAVEHRQAQAHAEATARLQAAAGEALASLAAVEATRQALPTEGDLQGIATRMLLERAERDETLTPAPEPAPEPAAEQPEMFPEQATA